MARRRKAIRRAKYITIYSPFVMKETKHELVGEPIETPNGRMQWARCIRTRQMQLVNLDIIENELDKSQGVLNVSIEDAKKYDIRENYEIGDIIFHPVWEDVGIVRSKETTSSGLNAIIVQFQKNNEKKLIENLKT